MENIKQQLRDLIAEVGEIPHDFDATAHLYLDLGVPSVAAMNLLMEIESRFNVQMPDDAFVEAVTLDQLADVVSGLVQGGVDTAGAAT